MAKPKKVPGQSRTQTESLLRAVMREKQIGVSDLAEHLGVAREMISRYLNRGVVPDHETARRMELALAVDPNEKVRGLAANLIDWRNQDEAKQLEKAQSLRAVFVGRPAAGSEIPSDLSAAVSQVEAAIGDNKKERTRLIFLLTTLEQHPDYLPELVGFLQGLLHSGHDPTRGPLSTPALGHEAKRGS